MPDKKCSGRFVLKQFISSNKVSGIRKTSKAKSDLIDLRFCRYKGDTSVDKNNRYGSDKVFQRFSEVSCNDALPVFSPAE